MVIARTIARTVEKKSLSAKGLLGIVQKAFDKVREPGKISKTKPTISIADCLMSALAMFGLKFPSLLQFDQKKKKRSSDITYKPSMGSIKLPLTLTCENG